MKKVLPLKQLLFLLLISVFNNPENLFAQTGKSEFKVGDVVEASYTGDWQRAKIVGGLKDNGAEGRYEVLYEGRNYTDYVSSKWVRPLFRSDVTKRFNQGDQVEFRRWNDKLYNGEVIGVDDKKYEIRFNWDGRTSTEWVNEMNVRASASTPTLRQVNTANPIAAEPKTAAKPLAQQKYKIGERVMYHDVGFLTPVGYGTVVSYDAEKRLYTVKDEKDPSWKYSYACYEVLAPGEKINNDFYIGKWEVSVSGATSTFTKNGDKYRRFSSGMKLPPLEIKADGIYVWTTLDNKVIRGVWRHRNGVPGITIIKGLDGLDWTVYENTEAMAPTKKTRDEIRFHHIPSSTGYYMANRVGENKSCVLAGRTLK